MAQTLTDWLPAALDDRVETSMSTQIDKGTAWFDELLRALDDARCAIVCLTPEAVESPWIHFEAGLLVRTLSQLPDGRARDDHERRVFPLLFGLSGGALSGPLASYQSTDVADADDMVRFLETIWNFVPDTGRAAADIRSGWRKRWKTLKQELEAIPAVPLKEIVPDLEGMFRRKTFQERMHDCLSQNWIERYNGARDTQLTLKMHTGTVKQACRPFIADVFEALVTALDSYAMGLSKMIGQPESRIDPESGTLVFDNPGLATACERQRMTIRRLVSRLVDERLAPILDEAFRFDAAETFEERKRLIHRKSADLVRYESLIRTGADSDWEFDRIMYYVLEEEQGDARVEDTVYRSRLELEKLNAKTTGWSLVPLSYSLGPLEKALSHMGQPVESHTAAQLTALMHDIRGFIERTKTDAGAQVRTSLARIEKLLFKRVELQTVTNMPNGSVPAKSV